MITELFHSTQALPSLDVGEVLVELPTRHLVPDVGRPRRRSGLGGGGDLRRRERARPVAANGRGVGRRASGRRRAVPPRREGLHPLGGGGGGAGARRGGGAGPPLTAAAQCPTVPRARATASSRELAPIACSRC